MSNNITVLIPTSPIPSHPSTAILDETIANIRKYTDAEIIIMQDGVHESLQHRLLDYQKYCSIVNKRMHDGSYGNCRVIPFPEHNHQSMMTRYVLCNLVKTPLVMFCEHDTSPIGDIPFDDICQLIGVTLNCVRFNIFHEIPDEHRYLMLGKTEVVLNDPIRRHFFERTIQWSQRPHIAKTEWYIKILETYFKDQNQRSMIEDVMHSVVQTAYEAQGQDTFGLAIYTPEGNQLRSYHSDGRGDDQKIITA
jgi:hypothetical protein